MESQLFIMELARELNKICQVSSILSFCHRQTYIYSIPHLYYLYPRGQISSATSGPLRTSGRPVCVGISSWNGLLCWRREYRYVRSTIGTVCVTNNSISYMHLLQLPTVFMIIFIICLLFCLKCPLRVQGDVFRCLQRYSVYCDIKQQFVAMFAQNLLEPVVEIFSADLLMVAALFLCFLSSRGSSSLTTSMRSQRRKTGRDTSSACWREGGSTTWRPTKE